MIKRNQLTVFFTLALALALALPGAALAKQAPSASAGVDIYSKYVWRGFELSDESLVVQPSASVTYHGVTLGLWGNLDTDPGGNAGQPKWNETDLALSYDTQLGIVGLGVGYIYYALDGVQDSQELYLSVSLDTLLAPTLTIYREFASLPAWYISLGVSHSFALPKGISLDLAAQAGWYASQDDAFVEVDQNLAPTTKRYNALHDGLVTVGLTIPLGEYLSVSPMLGYTFPLSDKAQRLIESSSMSGESAFIFGGVSLGLAF